MTSQNKRTEQTPYSDNKGVHFFHPLYGNIYKRLIYATRHISQFNTHATSFSDTVQSTALKHVDQHIRDVKGENKLTVSWHSSNRVNRK